MIGRFSAQLRNLVPRHVRQNSSGLLRNIQEKKEQLRHVLDSKSSPEVVKKSLGAYLDASKQLWPTQVCVLPNRGFYSQQIREGLDKAGILPFQLTHRLDEPKVPTLLEKTLNYIGGTSNKIEDYTNPGQIRAAIVDISHALPGSTRVGVAPGIGFFAETTELHPVAQALGVQCLMPGAEAITLTGEKDKMKQLAYEAYGRLDAQTQSVLIQAPVIPGNDDGISIDSDDLEKQTLAFFDKHGPMVAKLSLGGGGMGLKILDSREDIPAALNELKSYEKQIFPGSTVLLEKKIENSQHLEFQAVIENEDVSIIGKRNCSKQFNQQKIEQISVPFDVTNKSEKALLDFMKEMGKFLQEKGYRGVGTIEFLLDQDGKFNFMEVNPRIQIEHDVTGAELGHSLLIPKLNMAALQGVPLNIVIGTDIKELSSKYDISESRIYSQKNHYHSTDHQPNIPNQKWETPFGIIKLESTQTTSDVGPRNVNAQVGNFTLIAQPGKLEELRTEAGPILKQLHQDYPEFNFDQINFAHTLSDEITTQEAEAKFLDFQQQAIQRDLELQG